MQFSANLGFLWTDLSLPDAIRAAAQSGFDAVECHWPYATPTCDVITALQETKLEMLGLNTHRGNQAENGLSAVPGREPEAMAAIDQALEYAVAIGAKSIHVMAGITSHPEAHSVFCHHLRYACQQAMPHNIQILIEPLNPYDAPGYFLNSSSQAMTIIEEVNHPLLRLMFDCYHYQIIQGDICRSFEQLLPYIGHVQIAAVPTRTEPGTGEINYAYILAKIGELGWKRPIGAEYKTQGSTELTLDWLAKFKTIPVY